MSPDAVNQLDRVYGFRNHFIATRGETCLAVRFEHTCGNSDNHDVFKSRDLTDQAGGLKAVDIRHDEIHQDQIGRPGGGNL